MVEQSSLEVARLLANSGAELDRSHGLSRSAPSRTIHSIQRRSIDLSTLSGTILTPWFRTATSRPLRCHECPKSISLNFTTSRVSQWEPQHHKVVDPVVGGADSALEPWISDVHVPRYETHMHSPLIYTEILPPISSFARGHDRVLYMSTPIFPFLALRP